MIIKLPETRIDYYQICYNPVTHLVDIPIIPNDTTDAACILAVFIDMLIECGTLTPDEVYQVVLQATGKL